MPISIRSNLASVQRKLSALAYQQLPYATASALNLLAGDVAKAEERQLRQQLDRPVPFTTKAIGIQKARKDNLRVVVFMRDKTAAYLQPYEEGGVNKLNSRALLKPVNVTLNQYGNLPRNAMARLKGRANVFVGTVKTKAGNVDGVWQRKKPSRRSPGGLKLLIRFADAHPTKAVLGWHARARQVIRSNVDRRLGQAIARAVATAR
jgi:hypothetical protein